MRITKSSRRQMDQLADILSNLGVVALASVVIPAMFDKYDLKRLLLGLLAALLLWFFSLRLRR